MSLTSIPIDILEIIFSCLDGASFCRLSLTCHQLSSICSNERYWEYRCKNDFLVASQTSESSWRCQYGSFYRRYAKVGIETYRRVRSAWTKIENFFNSHNSRIVFDDGATWDDIHSFQNQLGSNIMLPNDFICSLMIHNGQKIDENVLNGLSSGAFGSLYAYEEYKTEFLASTMNVLIAQSHVNANRKHSDLSFVCLTIAVTNKYWSHSHLLCVSPVVNSDSKINFGSVVLAPQLRHRYELPTWIVANSYLEWLEFYANGLNEGRFALSVDEPLTDNNELLGFYCHPGCDIRTGPFSCRVATAFIPEDSSVTNARFCFAYRITLKMDEDADASLSCRLESRHWVITDDTGKVDRVDGPGVIGEFPVLEPGTTFSYVSCTAYSTRKGQMTGYFTMKYLSSPNNFVNIACPVFIMEAPDFEMLQAVDASQVNDSLDRSSDSSLQ